MSEIVLTLPDKLAEEAKAKGLLKPDSIAAMLRAELRRRRVNGLFSAADRLAYLDEPMSESEINDEIAAYRLEKQKT